MSSVSGDLLSPFIRRLSAFGASADEARTAAAALRHEPKTRPRGSEIADSADGTPQIVVSGWAARTRLEAGRTRQILGFVLPGESIGSFWRPPDFVFWRHNALTRVALASTQGLLTLEAQACPLRGQALAAARRAEDHAQHLQIDHMVRLGGRDAYAGLAHLLLELHARLRRAGLAHDGEFHMPVGQRVLADAMGFSVAHTNLTLQRMTADGLFRADAEQVRLLRPERMAEVAGFTDRDPSTKCAATGKIKAYAAPF